MANQKKTIDPVFAEFQRTAPRLDLAFFLAAIGNPKNIARPDRFGVDTPDTIREMVLLYMELSTARKPGSPTAQRRRVFELVDRYRASRPRDWSVGSYVAPAPFVEPVEPEPVDVVEPIEPEPVDVAPEPEPEPEPETWWPTTLTDDQLMENALIAAANGRAIIASRHHAEPDADADRISDLTLPSDPAWNGQDVDATSVEVY